MNSVQYQAHVDCTAMLIKLVAEEDIERICRTAHLLKNKYTEEQYKEIDNQTVYEEYMNVMEDAI